MDKPKPLSKMNKKELYEKCQQLQSELHTATLFNASLEEETKSLLEELELNNKTLRKRLHETREKLKHEKESLELILEDNDNMFD